MLSLKTLLDLADELTRTDTKTLQGKTLKAMEELGELSSKILSYEGTSGALHRFTTQTQIVEEVSDTFLGLWSIARSVGASNEDLLEMLQRKIEKWQHKQIVEGSLKNPTKIPFEIHVSIAADDPAWYDYPENLKAFSDQCYSMAVKPVLLDLYRDDGSITKDWMTSSTILGTNQDADKKAREIVEGLWDWIEGLPSGSTALPLRVVRSKIETVPWHPVAPQFSNSTEMPKDCYFEKHWEIAIPIGALPQLLDFSALNCCGVSRNTRKPMLDGMGIFSLTRRSEHKGVREVFERDCDRFEAEQIRHEFEIVDSLMEFSIHDTAIHRDAEWIKKYRTG